MNIDLSYSITKEVSLLVSEKWIFKITKKVRTIFRVGGVFIKLGFSTYLLVPQQLEVKIEMFMMKILLILIILKFPLRRGMK